MSLHALNQTLDQAFARAAMPTQKASSYTNMLGPLGDINVASDWGRLEEDQYKYYKGRVYSAGRIIVNRIAQQGFYVGKKMQRRRRESQSLLGLVEKGMVPPSGIPRWIGNPDMVEVLDVHPFLSTMSNPNPWCGQFNTLEMVLGSLIAVGRAYLVALKGKDRMWDIFAIPATWMKPDGNDWKIAPPGSMSPGVEVSDSQVAHFYFADPKNPHNCLSPVAMLAGAITLDGAIMGANHAEFQNGPLPKMALIAGDVMSGDNSFMDGSASANARPVKLDAGQRQQIITWFRQQFAGAMKFGLPLVLDAVIRDVKILSRKPSEMAFLESSNMTKSQINEGFGVSPLLMGASENANRATGALIEQIFADNILNPIITMISQALTRKLGPLFSVDGESLVAWIEPVMPKDTELDIELLTLGVRSYAFTRNEIRSFCRKRWGGLPNLDGFDNVVIPQTMEPHDPEDVWEGAGRKLPPSNGKLWVGLNGHTR